MSCNKFVTARDGGIGRSPTEEAIIDFLDHAHGEATPPNAKGERRPGMTVTFACHGCQNSSTQQLREEGLPALSQQMAQYARFHGPGHVEPVAPQVEPGQQYPMLVASIRELGAEVERLTKERDEALAARDSRMDEANRYLGQFEDEQVKLSASQAEVERLMSTKTLLEESLEHRLSASQERVKALEEKVDSLDEECQLIDDAIEAAGGMREGNHPAFIAARDAENARLAKELAELTGKVRVAARRALTNYNERGSRGLVGCRMSRNTLIDDLHRALSEPPIAAPDAPRPIVVGSMWMCSDGFVSTVTIVTVLLIKFECSNGQSFKWSPEHFLSMHTWLSDPPPQRIPAGEGEAK